jgi:hypothetical protein
MYNFFPELLITFLFRFLFIGSKLITVHYKSEYIYLSLYSSCGSWQLFQFLHLLHSR